MRETERQYLEDIFKSGSLQVISSEMSMVDEFVDIVTKGNTDVSLVNQIVGRAYKSARMAKVIKVDTTGTGSYARHLSTKYLPLNTILYITTAEKFEPDSYGTLKGALSSSATVQRLVVLFLHNRNNGTDVSDIVETFNDLYSSNLVPATSLVTPKALIYGNKDTGSDGSILLSIIEDLISNNELRISVSI